MSSNNKKNTDAKKAVQAKKEPVKQKEPVRQEMTFDEAVRIIDCEMANLGKLAGKDAKAVRAKWEELKKNLNAGLKDLVKAMPREAALGLAHGGGTKGKPAKANPPKKGAKAEPEKRPEPPRLDLPKAPLPKSVVITPHSLECYLGSFAVEALATRDASEFLSNDKVFWYRRAMFPDPTSAKVQPKVMSVLVVKRKDARFTRAPYTVWVDINIQGDPAHVKAWAEGVVNKNRGDQE